MVLTKREDVTKQGFCKMLCRKLRLRGSLLLVLIQFWGRGGVGLGVGALLSLSGSGMGRRWGGVGAYSRWALIRGWALIRINAVTKAGNMHQA